MNPPRTSDLPRIGVQILETALISERNNHSLPDDAGSMPKSASQHARRIILEVSDTPLENFNFDDPGNKGRFLRVGTVIANLNDVDGTE